jgi:hypothetical protein
VEHGGCVGTQKDEDGFLSAPFEAPFDAQGKQGKRADTFAGANVKEMASASCVGNDGGFGSANCFRG